MRQNVNSFLVKAITETAEILFYAGKLRTILRFLKQKTRFAARARLGSIRLKLVQAHTYIHLILEKYGF